MAAIIKKELVDEVLSNVYACGGSLIAKNVILTGEKLLSTFQNQFFNPNNFIP
jgi:hypothetical protein